MNMITAIHAPRSRSLKWGHKRIAPVVQTGATKRKYTTMSSTDTKLPQSDGAEHGFVYDDKDGLAEVRVRVNSPKALLELLVEGVDAGRIEADLIVRPRSAFGEN